MASLALSLKQENYIVFVNSDASGTFCAKTAQDAKDRMRTAGVHVLSMFAIAMELMRDWRNTPGAETVMPWLAKYYPVYGILAQAHGGAVENGTIIDGEDVLLPN